MSPSVIAVVGGLNMDMVLQTERVPDFGESMDAVSLDYYPGGKGANTAIATYRASRAKPGNGALNGRDEEEGSASNNGGHGSQIRVFMNGTVGSDDFGTQLRTKLEQMGIDVSGVLTVEGKRSGTCVVIVEMDSGESRNLAHQGANLKWKPREKDSVECLAGGEKPDLVIAHLGIPREVVTRLLATASKNGIDTLLNPSPAVYLTSTTYKHVTHLLMNETEAAMLSDRSVNELNNLAAWQEAAENFIQLGVKNVVITLAAKGAYYSTHKGEKGVVSAVQNVQVMDTTGAGDTFVGTYSVEYIRQKQLGEWDISKAIARACKASAKTIERIGAQESIPWADEIDQYNIVIE